MHSGGRDVTAGSSHDFGTYCECGIGWDSICSVLLAYQKKWRIRIIKSSEEKEQSGSGSGAAEEGPDDGNNGQDERDNPVYEWYTRCGRERIKAISTNIFAHGKNEFWIRTDGVCNIRTPKGYRRAGNLPGYPGAQANTITEYLKQDGFYAVNDGRYIYVSR